MKLMTIDDLKTLTGKRKGPCISIFMPAHRAKPHAQQNPIRFKNLLAKAERYLLARGLKAQPAGKFLNPAQRLLKDRMFWQYQSDGLALFLSAKIFRYYRLPISFKELVVMDRFHTKPLLPLFSINERFYLLALSQKQVKLFEGSRYSLREVELEGVPKNISEALKYDDREKQLQFHTGTPQGGGRRAAIFHGHGVGKEDIKENILRYFQMVNKGLHQLLKKERAPLVLTGVDYLFPIYREANTYPYLLDKGVPGNPDRQGIEKLHEQTWFLLKPLLLKTQKEAAARYKQLRNTEQTSTDIKKIIMAAYRGQVEVLFVSVGIQRWGIFDPQRNTVNLHAKMKPGDWDLLDFIAVHTLLNGGTVFAVKPDKVPDGKTLAAVFRY
ncbi:MAG: hypothetical protein ABII96_02545 [Candidatus Zixiibacteriota bacterium]